ncbi:hypothetical protein Tco_0018590 [Tanacetum coccineum]
MQAVPPPMTGNYLPSGPDIEIDDSKYTYGPEKTQPNEPDSQTNEVDTCDSNISTETSELVFEPVVNESHVEVQPKVWSDAPIYQKSIDQIVIMMMRIGKAVITVGEKLVIAVKSQQVVKWSKPGYNKRKSTQTLKNKGINDRWSSMHIDSSENQTNIHAGQQATNQNEGSQDKIDSGNSLIEDESAQDCFEVPYWHSYSSTNTSSSKSDEKRRSPREEEQVFLDDLARLQRQEKEANEEAEALIRNHDQDTEKAVTQAEAEKTSSTNDNPFSNTTIQEDDYEKPLLEDIHADATDVALHMQSYDDEGCIG